MDRVNFSIVYSSSSSGPEYMLFASRYDCLFSTLCFAILLLALYRFEGCHGEEDPCREYDDGSRALHVLTDTVKSKRDHRNAK